MPRWGSKPPDGWGFSLKGEDGWEGKGEGSWWSPHDLFGKTSSQVFCPIFNWVVVVVVDFQVQFPKLIISF